MATNDLQTNLDIIDDFTQRLQVAVIGAEETTAKHEKWVEGTVSETIPTANGPIKTLRGIIAEWEQQSDATVNNAILGYDSQFESKLTDFENDFINYLLTIGFEPAIIYQPGITLTRRPQTVAYQGVIYYWGGSLPYTTTGDFSSEPDWLIAQIVGGIEIPQMSFASGGTIVRKTQSVLGTDGEWYFWTGSFPKIIPPTSTLDSAGGVGLNKFRLASGTVPLRPLMKIVATAAGFVLNQGSFEYGATLTSSSQVLSEFGTGKLWKWDGPVPKIVDANSSPVTSGGIGNNLWNEVTTATGTSGSGVSISETPPVSVGTGHRWYCTADGKTYIRYADGDSVQWVEESPQSSVFDGLRVDLASEQGASMLGIGGGRTQDDKNNEWVSITDAPYLVKFDNGITDNTAAFTAAFTSGKKIWIPHPGPGNYAMVNGPVYFDDGTEVQGPGKWVEVIRASSTFPQNVDVISPLKLSQGSSIPTKHFAFRDFLINANGWTRSIGVADSCSGLVLAACEEYEVSNVVSKNSPKWNFRFSPFNSYADLGHLGHYTSPNKSGRVWGLHSEDYLDGDGFIVEGTEHLQGYGCTHTTTAQAKLLKTYERRHTGFQVVEGSKHVIFEKSFVDGGGTQMTAYGAGAHVNRPAVYDVLFKDSDAKGVNRLFAVWSDPATDISFDDPRWACRSIRAENCRLTHPIVDPGSTTLPSRVVDLQYVKDSHNKDVGVVFTGEPDESPVALINFGPGVNCSVDGFYAKGVPGIPANTYSVDRNCGWVRTSDTTPSHSSGLVVRNISLDNIGFVNRVVHDSGEKAFVLIDGINVEAIPSDGQEKVGVVSGSLKLDVKRIKGPAGFVKYKLGRSFSAFPYDDVSIRSADISQIDTVIGGLRIRSETNAGVQPVPGVLFDRQFVSASDPTGANGKGAISFRTSAAAEGRLSFTAYHEDTGEYRPLAQFHSTDTQKALAPVLDNALSFGLPSARGSIGFFAQGVQTTSDAKFKSDVRQMTEQELAASMAISRSIGIFTWLSENSDRLHAGTTVQTVIQCMEDAGLNAFDYGFVCYDKWDDEYVDVVEVVTDADGNVVGENPTGERILTKRAGDIYSLRDHELYKFLIRGLVHRLELIEGALASH